MSYISYIFSQIFVILLDVVDLILIARLIVSILLDEENRLFVIVFYMSETILTPFRVLFSKISFIRESPIDITYLIVMVIITVLRYMLLL